MALEKQNNQKDKDDGSWFRVFSLYGFGYKLAIIPRGAIKECRVASKERGCLYTQKERQLEVLNHKF